MVERIRVVGEVKSSRDVTHALLSLLYTLTQPSLLYSSISSLYLLLFLFYLLPFGKHNTIHIAGNFHLENIFNFFAMDPALMHGRKFYPMDFLPRVNDYIPRIAPNFHGSKIS